MQKKRFLSVRIIRVFNVFEWIVGNVENRDIFKLNARK